MKKFLKKIKHAIIYIIVAPAAAIRFVFPFLGREKNASKSETETAVLYFPNGCFIEGDVKRAINRYYGLKQTLGDGFKDFSSIYVVADDKVWKMK